MPDLNDDLFSSFKSEGTPVNPLPASEVRRRGDRMRRRNNALASVGGVAAALVVIATPLAVVANQSSDGDADRPPIASNGPTQVAWKQEIPGTVDVGSGLAGAATTPAVETSDRPGVATVEVCATTLFDAEDGTVDTAGATWAGEEGTGNAGNARTLVLYPDAVAATAVVEGLRAGAEQCRTETSGTDTLTYDLTDADLPADEAFVLARGYVAEGEQSAQGVDYYVVARTGNAVLVTVDPYAAAADEQVTFEQERVAEVVDQMQVFSETASRAVGTDDTTELDDLIPAEFPLLEGFPEQSAASGRAVGREGPARDLDLAPYNPPLVEACGTEPTGAPTPTDTMYAGWRDPSIGMLRQLMTFDSEEDAQTYAEAVVQVFEDCPEEQDGGVTRFHERSEESGYGDFAASVVTRFEVDGEPGPGHAVVQAVRVGASVLLFTAQTETAEPVDPAVGSVELTYSYLATNGPVIDAM